MSGDEATAADEEMVRRARAGDEAAARALFDRHVERLRARVRARLPGVLQAKVAASDVIQEAYLTAFLRLADFEDRGEGSFGRWIGRILENKVRDEVRRHMGTGKRSARREVHGTPSSEIRAEPSDRSPTPSAVAMVRETRRDVQRTIDGLPAGCQRILRLVHGEGLPLREVAERLGKSEEAVRRAYSRAVSAFTERVRRTQVQP